MCAVCVYIVAQKPSSPLLYIHSKCLLQNLVKMFIEGVRNYTENVQFKILGESNKLHNKTRIRVVTKLSVMGLYILNRKHEYMYCR